VANRTIGRPWPPESATVQAIAAVMCSHWAAAKRARARRFWTNDARWLDVNAVRAQTSPASRYHFTTGGRLIR
jgi:hypothetical protein